MLEKLKRSQAWSEPWLSPQLGYKSLELSLRLWVNLKTSLEPPAPAQGSVIAGSWNEQCSVIPNQCWEHLGIYILSPGFQITKLFSSVTLWWINPEWFPGKSELDLLHCWANDHTSPLAFSTQLPGRENGSGHSPLENGKKCSGEGCVCVCVCVSLVMKYLPGPGDGWHASVGDVFNKVLMWLFIGLSPCRRINPIN